MGIKEDKYKTLYFDITKEKDMNDFADEFLKQLDSKVQKYENIIFLCIGTDRATGDSLGPIVGNY
jgi:hypothetical protein